MISPAALHRDQVLMVSTSPEVAGADSLPDTDYPTLESTPTDDTRSKAIGQEASLLHIRMEDDLRKMKGIRSRQRSDDIKRGLIPHYINYCNAVLNRSERKHDSVFNRVCIWCFDVCEFNRGLLLAEYALDCYLVKPCGDRHTLSPQGFKRNLAEVLVEILADYVLKSADPEEHEDQLSRIMELTRQHDMNDHITAKLYRAYAMSIECSDPIKAIEHYTVSERLRPLSSIRKSISRLSRKPEVQPE